MADLDLVVEPTPEAWRTLVHGCGNLQALSTGFGSLSPTLMRLLQRGLGVRPDREAPLSNVLTERAEQWIFPRLLRRLARANAVSASFLSITFTRLLDDFRDHEFGTHNPPTQVTRLGGLHLVIFRLRCQQGLSRPEVIGNLNVGYGLEIAEANTLIDEVRVLTRRTGCGNSGYIESIDRPVDPDHGSTTLADQLQDEESLGPEEYHEASESRLAWIELLRALSPRLRLPKAEVERLLQQAVFERSHPPTEALVLHLHFVDNLSFASIGAMLRMNERTVQRIKEDGLTRYRESFPEWKSMAGWVQR